MAIGVAAPAFFGLSWGYAGIIIFVSVVVILVASREWVFGKEDFQGTQFSQIPIDPLARSATDEVGVVKEIAASELSIEDYAVHDALNLRVTSQSDRTRSALYITRITRWNDEQNGYATPDLFRALPPMIILANQTDLPKHTPRIFQLLEFTDPVSPLLRTKVIPEGFFREWTIPNKGTWRLDLQLRWDGGAKDITKCFRWSDAGLPVFVGCQRGDILREQNTPNFQSLSDLSAHSGFPIESELSWLPLARATSSDHGYSPVTAVGPLLENECYAVWSPASTPERLMLAVWNGTDKTSDFKVALKYVKRWSKDLRQYVETDRHAIFSFQIFHDLITPERFAINSLIEIRGAGFRLLSLETKRFRYESEHGAWKLVTCPGFLYQS
jgi:hypothetical protein